MHAGPAGRVITPDPGRRTHGKPGIQGGSYARLAQRATGARAAGRPVGCLRVCVRPRLAAVGAPKSPGGRYMGLCPLARRAAGRRRSPPSPTAALVTVRCRACGRVLMRRARPATLPSRSSGAPMSSHGSARAQREHATRGAGALGPREAVWGTPNCPSGLGGTPPTATAIASGARRAPSVAPGASPLHLALGAAPESPRGMPFPGH